MVPLIQNPRFQYDQLLKFSVESLLKIYLHEKLAQNLLKFCFELLQEKIQSYQKFKNVLLSYFDPGTYRLKKNKTKKLVLLENKNGRSFFNLLT